MVTLSELRSTVDLCIQNAQRGDLSDQQRKLSFLQCIRQRMMQIRLQDPKLQETQSRVLSWLEDDLDRYPLYLSRLTLAQSPDLSSMPWRSLRDGVANLADLVWRTITVRAGDCESCDEGDRVLVWSIRDSEVVLSCDECAATSRIDGTSVENGFIAEPPTTKALKEAGLI